MIKYKDVEANPELMGQFLAELEALDLAYEYNSENPLDDEGSTCYFERYIGAKR